MLEIKNLRKVYDNGHEALKDINLTIEEGDLICLLGPSGCGKTTILNLIAGLLDPTEGNISHNGVTLVDKHPKDRNMSLVFQNYALYPHMSVLENVMFPLTVGKNKISRQEAEKIALEYMELTNITDLKDKKPDTMSGGQQQRVAITRALVQQPKILLLDEPLSNLDARLRLKIREEIRRLVKKINITTIFVTHDQEEAMSISDKIVLMDDGVVQQFDESQALYLDPANLFVASFIGNPGMNIMDVTVKGGVVGINDTDIKLENNRFTAIADGTYKLGIRPEDINYDPNSKNTFLVDLVELMGKEAFVSMKVGTQNLKCIVPIEDQVSENNEYGFTFDSNKVFLFNVDGSRAL